MIGQRVAPCEENHVEIGKAEHLQADCDVVHAETVTSDPALGLERRERRQAAFERVGQTLRVRIAVRVAIDVVHVDQVDASEAEPLQAVFERAAHALRTVVVALHEGQRVDKTMLIARRIGSRFQQPADLGRQQIIIACPRAQRIADAPLG